MPLCAETWDTNARDSMTAKMDFIFFANVEVHTSATGGEAPTQGEGGSDPEKSDSERVADCGATTCSPFDSDREALPLPNQHGGIESLMTGSVKRSWVIKAVNTVFGSDLTPGIDLVILLESPDGIINELRFILGITRETDTPGIVQESCPSCRLSVLWNEVEKVDGVLLSLPSHALLSAFFLQLVTAFTHLMDRADELLANSIIEQHAV
jgi:hypothetical protein